MSRARVPIGVLVSGSGTNLQALLDHATDSTYPATVRVVISNKAGVQALDRAAQAGVEAIVLSHRDHADRAAYDRALVDALRARGVEWVVLAGFMRLLTPTFLEAFPGRVINVHPALLPAFPGTHAQGQAVRAGVRIAGVTVHLVDSGTDTGPIVAQGALGVPAGTDEATLQQRLLRLEHRLLPRVVRWAVEGRLHVEGSSVRVDLPPGEAQHEWLAD